MQKAVEFFKINNKVSWALADTMCHWKPKLLFSSKFFNELVNSWKYVSVNNTSVRVRLQYVNTGKYCFILQILTLGLFTEVLLISILMLSIQNLILIYWYFKYFTVSVSYVLNHWLTAVIWDCLPFNMHGEQFQLFKIILFHF